MAAIAGPPPSPSPPPSPPPAPAHRRLSGSDLLALQLLARGYSLDQVTVLRRVEVADTLWDFQRVLTALEVSTVAEAIAAARRRGLLA